ncbi:MAG TPA: UDP-N-acetylmuramoyl-L-alanyl-D-glutamate--2,6-diaminopimelate ligase [Gammaproteobacteria bacterium]|nr:UDP-N-acetylmuramoyl-L-alanyl-D-glutamate--2,6-diaminopimelate ligase [Gammaproteobacteria bacterium]
MRSKMLSSLFQNQISFTGLAQNSQLVQPGFLFLACKGNTFDGRQYIDEAIQRGAVAVLADAESIDLKEELRYGVRIVYLPNLSNHIPEIARQFYDFPAKKLQIIGVTGTNGKTSCTHFLAQALSSYGALCGIIGTLGSGLLGSLQNTLMTTPDTVTLQRMFAEFVKQNARYVAMEVSSHSLDQKRIEGVEFTVGIFTNLTQDHLDYHGTMADYGAAKKKLFTDYALKHAIINIDDAFGRELQADLPTDQVISYSINNHKAQIYTREVSFDIAGVRAYVVTPWGEGQLNAPLIGEFNLSNVLAVLGALGALGLPLEAVLAAMMHLKSAPGRMQILGGGSKPTVIIDYAHTPDALEKTLLALRKHCQGKLYCVFGCGGDRDKGKRPLMGAIAEAHADHVVLTSDNPRHENPHGIIQEILVGLKSPNRVFVQEDRSKAIQEVIQCAAQGDYVLIAGKGAETYQQIGDEKRPFNDCEQAAKWLS